MFFRLFHTQKTMEESKILLQEGYDLYNQKRYLESIVKFKKAIECDKNVSLNPDIWQYIAIGYYYSNRYNEAIQNQNEALIIAPKCENYWIWKACILREMHNFEGSREAFEKSLEINPSNSKTWNLLGDLYYHNRKLTDAIKAYSISLSYNDEDPIVLGNKASVQFDCYWKLKRDKEKEYPLEKEIEMLYEILGTYKKIILITPDNAEIHKNLGETYALLQQYESALDSFNRTLNLYSQKGKAPEEGFNDIWSSLADVLRNLGRDDEAEEYMNKIRQNTRGMPRMRHLKF